MKRLYAAAMASAEWRLISLAIMVSFLYLTGSDPVIAFTKGVGMSIILFFAQTAWFWWRT